MSLIRSFVVPLLAGAAFTVVNTPAFAQDVASCIASHEAAQRARRGGHLRAARSHLDACDRSACPKPIQQDCARWQGEVAAELPTIVLSVIDADGKPPVGIRISVDGRSRPDASLGKTFELDPGEHRLSARVADGRVVTRRIVALLGAHNQLVELRLPAPTTVAAPEKTPSLPVAFWVAGAAAIVGGGAFAILGGIGVADEKDLRARCAGRCPPDDVSRVERTYLAADIFGLLGIAGATTASVIGIVHLSADPKKEMRAPAGVRLGLGPRGGSATWCF